MSDRNRSLAIALGLVTLLLAVAVFAAALAP